MAYETRVWSEDGTLLGRAVVELTGKRSAQVCFYEVDTDSGYAWGDTEFSGRGEAEDYAREWAEEYAEDLQENCPCDTFDCGAINFHGIHVQYCRDGFSVDSYS